MNHQLLNERAALLRDQWDALNRVEESGVKYVPEQIQKACDWRFDRIAEIDELRREPAGISRSREVLERQLQALLESIEMLGVEGLFNRERLPQLRAIVRSPDEYSTDKMIKLATFFTEEYHAIRRAFGR